MPRMLLSALDGAASSTLGLAFRMDWIRTPSRLQLLPNIPHRDDDEVSRTQIIHSLGLQQKES